MNCTVDIDSSLRSYGQEILRRRLIGGEVKSDLRNTLAEVAFLRMYGMPATVDDLQHKNKRALNFITEDSEGRTVRISNRISPPYRVYAKHLDVDIYVFCSTSKDLKTCIFHGWLDATEVQEAPVFWFEEEGKRTDYCHEVDKQFMYTMPDTMSFNRTCRHQFATWDYMMRSWSCGICSKGVYDMDLRGRLDATDAG